MFQRAGNRRQGGDGCGGGDHVDGATTPEELTAPWTMRVRDQWTRCAPAGATRVTAFATMEIESPARTTISDLSA